MTNTQSNQDSMTIREITVPQMDGETQTETSYSVSLDSEAFTRAVERGASELSAFRIGRFWYYKAEETDEIYRLTDREIAAYGAGKLDARGVDYSLWCTYCGALVKRPSAAIHAAVRQ